MPTVPKPPVDGRASRSPSAIVDLVSAKERLLKEVRRWSEHDAEVALRAVEQEHALDDRDVDEGWGDLDAHTEAANRETMRMLDDEEAAAGFAPWKREDLS